VSGNGRDIPINIIGTDNLTSAAQSSATGSEGASKRIAAAFGALASAAKNVLGGELGELAERAGSALEGVAEHGKSMGAKLAATGVATAGIGAALVAMGDKGKAADQQLAQSFENSGHSIDDFGEEIEKNVKHLAKFGDSAPEVKTALMKINDATGDPKKSLDLLGEAADLAASKHESLTTAADQMAKIVAGKGTKILATYGITMDNAKASTVALAGAQKAHETAVDSLAKANQNLTELEARDAGNKPLSIAQQQALQHAHEAVATAQDKVGSTAATLATAQAGVKSASEASGKALEDLGSKIKGQATAASDTFTGRLKAMRTELMNHVEEYGAKYGPAITATGAGITVMGGLVGAASKTVTFFKEQQIASTIATGAHTVATGIASAATMAWTGVQAAFNLVMDANPLVLVGIAIAALVAGVIIAYNKVGWFRDLVREGFAQIVGFGKALWNDGIKPIFDALSKAWGDVWNFMQAAWNSVGKPLFSFIGDHWGLIFAVLTGGFSLIIQHWHEIWGFLQAAWNTVGKPVFDIVGSAIGIAARGIGAAFSGIGTAFSAVWSGVKAAWNSVGQPLVNGFKSAFDAVSNAITSIPNGFKAIWNTLAGLWNTAAKKFSFTVPSIIPGIGGKTFGLPALPTLATGGIVRASPGGTALIAGEGGQDEAIVPLSSDLKALGAMGGGGTSVIVQITGHVYGSVDDLARTVLEGLQRAKGRGTALGLA